MVAEQRIREEGLSGHRVAPTPAPASDRAVSAPRARRAMAHSGPPVLRRAKAIHENTRVPGAVLLATFTVTILLLYLCAYASVTSEGFELSRYRALNKQASLQRDTLQAEISRLSLPQTVAQRAALLQMEPGTPQTLTIVPAESSPAMTPETPNR